MSPRRRPKKRITEGLRQGAVADTSAQTHGPTRRFKGSRRTNIALAAAAVLAVSLALLSSIFVLSSLGGRSGPPPENKAVAIIDQLVLTFPDPAFIERATNLLEEAGYRVDHYSGEQVTVDFYQELPTYGYDLIILRVHAARRPDVLQDKLPDEAALFTAEEYSPDRHVSEQEALRLVKVSQSAGDPNVYFGLRSDFIAYSMKGSFDGATIVLMGCDGLRTSRTAEAFVHKGAKVVVGWDGLVSASQTDAATERLLQHLVVDGLSVEEAVQRTGKEVGPDPGFSSSLRLYLPPG